MKKKHPGEKNGHAERTVWSTRDVGPGGWSGSTEGRYQTEHLGLISQAKGLGLYPTGSGKPSKGFSRGVTWSESPVRPISPVEKCGGIVWRRESLAQWEGDSE